MGLLACSIPQQRSGHRFYLDINLELGSLLLGGILSGTKSYGAETLTIVRADPDNDRGDPKEQLTRYNRDLSWDEEIAAFTECIFKGKPVQSGNTKEALRTMRLVFQIYYADSIWRKTYDIPNPD